jgi:hypothetical protein
MDKICYTEAVRASGVTVPATLTPEVSLENAGYDVTNTYLDSRDEESTYYSVPAVAWKDFVAVNAAPADTAILVSSRTTDRSVAVHRPSFGPFPKAGCWFDPAYPNTAQLQAEYMACLRADDVFNGLKSPSECN